MHHGAISAKSFAEEFVFYDDILFICMCYKVAGHLNENINSLGVLLETAFHSSNEKCFG